MASSSFRQATLAWGNEILRFSNLENDPQTKHILTDLKGWFGGVGVKGEDQDRLGHGVYITRKHRAPRIMTLEATLVYADEAQRDIADRYVSGILGSGELGLLTATNGNLELHTEVVLDGDISHSYLGKNALRIQVPLKAPDPHLYAPVQDYQLFPAGAGTGLEYNLFSSGGVLTYGDFVQNSQLVVTNNGNTEAFPVFTTQGNFPGGVTITDGHGHTVELRTPIVSTSPVTIDMRGSVTRAGADISYLLTRRDWFSIPAGGHIQPSVSSLQEGDGFVDITLQDTYL